MTNIFDVAKYLLSTFGEMSTMKLQKLCYYAQAWHLAVHDKPLFKEEFQAWANGPVCPELFNIHKGLFSITPKDISGNKCSGVMTAQDINFLNSILDTFGPYMGAQLSEMTHNEKPWIEARGDYPLGQNCSNIISKESMKKFYRSMMHGKKQK